MFRPALSALSHLALWPGVYIAAAALYFLDLTGLRSSPAVTAWCIAFALCAGTGGYLLDRVKLRDRWLDEADRAAHRERFEFIASHAVLVRVLAGVLLLGAVTLGWFHPLGHRWMASAPLAGALGVIVYAPMGRAARRRPKDVLILKNLYVSVCITIFAVLVAWTMFESGQAVPWNSAPWAFAGGTLLVRVFSDAMLCDLDDRASDLAFGTATVPTLIGRRAAWNAAMGLRLALAGAIALIPIGPWPMRAAWAAATASSSILLRLTSPAKVRTWVDVRFGLEAAIVRLLV